MLRYHFEVFYELNDDTCTNVLDFDTDNLDFIYQLIGQNSNWVTDDNFMYFVYDTQRFLSTKVYRDNNTYPFADNNILFSK